MMRISTINLCMIQFINCTCSKDRNMKLNVPFSACYVGYGSASTPPDAVTYACPCQSPLKCIGKQLIEVPLGEIGKFVLLELIQKLRYEQTTKSKISKYLKLNSCKTSLKNNELKCETKTYKSKVF